ncbi:TetR family transcriptional regulator [Streptomyces sp. NRRL WC-3742]|uniref:TetR family transcriptional regulator n=1 Tax=Streptomyces sp. NRRL WC-3742 TaxID=1463934 RepID=UPI00099BD789|nr:TetR family transcriptional regulator [Streptomyces sp. NRRL WC-3742]
MTTEQPTAALPDAPTDEVQAMLEAPLSLRERKKLKTRQTIRREAYRLFSAQGFDSTTVEQIAAAAEVSPSTFFRYFATKEDLVLTDEYDPAILAAVLQRPAGEPFLESCRAALLGMIRHLREHDREELFARMRLVHEVPSLRAGLHRANDSPQQLFLAVLTRRAGVEEPTYDMRVAAAVLGAATTEAVMRWAESDGREDITDLVDRAFELLTSAFAGL